MNKKRWLIIVLLVALPALLYGQRFRAGLGLVPRERIFSPNEVKIDTLLIREGGIYDSDIVSMPYLGYRLVDAKRISAEIGVQYYSNYLSLNIATSVPYEGGIQPVRKGKTVGNRNLEFPLHLGFNVIEHKAFRLTVFGELVPVWNIISFDKMKEVPKSSSWTQEIVDALNAVETIPRRFYLNYSFGLSVEYGRFGAFFSRYHNLQRSISKGYTLYGKTYPFRRRISSSRFGLYYRFDLGKKKKNTT